MPANGKIPIAEAILINACNVIHVVTPIAVSFENLSFADFAILSPSQKNKKNKIIKPTDPIIPNSSPNIAKIESVIAAGRCPNFWLDMPSPFPKNPPDPSAIMDCFICQPLPRGSDSGCKKINKRSSLYGSNLINNNRAPIPPEITAIACHMGVLAEKYITTKVKLITPNVLTSGCKIKIVEINPKKTRNGKRIYIKL
ncbi:MAG: hypothetical protein US35_C0012G0018 [Parcubacteria group bacterium GW2011_GWA2_37_10]|nr:MAG: hypothetical protein US35_C0012G0018 [Parcubacteria group bacterium GW2011_GWA2_37_10]